MAETDNEGLAVTRVYVSGLPPSLTEDQLRSHFAEKYPVTDAHVIPNRRIGFVGFTTHEHAKSAVNYFNRTFIRMSKISVTLARPVEIRRDPSGQAAPISHRFQRHADGRPEVLGVSSKKRKRDTNDDGDAVPPTSQSRTECVAEANGADLKQDDRLEEQDGPTLDSRVVDNMVETVAQNAPASDADWLRAKTNRLLDLVEEGEPDARTSSDNALAVEIEPDTDEIAQATDGKTGSGADTGLDSSSTLSIPNARLFIRNLPFDAREDDLRNTFAPFGRLSEVRTCAESRSHQPNFSMMIS